MKLYRAVSRNSSPFRVFNPEGTAKPEGLYLAPSVFSARNWGIVLFSENNFDIFEIDVDSNVEVIAAIDGFYTEFGSQINCKYFVGALHEVLNNDYIKYSLKGISSRVSFASTKCKKMLVDSSSEIIIKASRLDAVKSIRKMSDDEIEAEIAQIVEAREEYIRLNS